MTVSSFYHPVDVPEDGKTPVTDYTRWRLSLSENGDHRWRYLKTDEECKEWPQTDVDRYWLGLPMEQPTLPPPKDALGAARNGLHFLKRLQSDDGHWPGEYGGPMFLLPGVVIASYVTGMTFREEERLEIIRYLFNLAHHDDGGWGLHVEGRTTVFGTALNYCVLRILGVSADHPVCVRARSTLYKLGGPTAAPSWGKAWLSILNVYDWEGCNSVPPELWLLPDWVPIQPHKWWIHCRMVYIPMSYLYGSRFQCEENDLILSLRQELYTQDYYSIDWPAHRNNIAKPDLYVPHSMVLDTIYQVLGVYEQCTLPPLRRWALDEAYKLVCMDDENTSYQDLAPVSKVLNLIVRFAVDGPESEAYKEHRRTRDDFLWIGPEGMRMTGTNGSQLWDLAFIAQALTESGLADEAENKDCLLNALEWLDRSQITENPPHYERAYRHATKGAWPFSTKTQGYTVSDCTGEGLKAALYIQNHVKGAPKLISDRRLCDAVDILLGMQNSDGGFASYELVRGYKWFELLNPAEVFGDIMTEHNYPECTTSVVTALVIFRKYYPEYRNIEIDRCIREAVGWLHVAQKPEGGWYGSWGICFTYATQFALESLSLVGEVYATSESARRACEFLLSKQHDDGGWGESWKSCEDMKYVDLEKSQVVQTAWAAMALIYAEYPHPEPIERAVKFVISRQRSDGSWPQEALEGIFNKTVTIAYPLFKFSFTIWMLGLAHKYLADIQKKKRSNSIANVHHNGHTNGHSGHANGIVDH